MQSSKREPTHDELCIMLIKAFLDLTTAQKQQYIRECRKHESLKDMAAAFDNYLFSTEGVRA